MFHKDRQKKYKEANKAFLEAKSREEGMTTLPSGVVFRRTETGSGKMLATPKSLVYVRYTGRLIDGTVFDSTDGQMLPACFPLSQLIMGWQILLVRMRAGDRIEAYIPYEHGYGNKTVGDIPAYSTLIFDIELVKVEQ